MSNTEHKRCQRLILISPFPNSAWALPELACSLDKFSVELGGWERAEPVRGALQCVLQFSREHILLWLPCGRHSQGSGELPSREQMPSCVREGLAWSLLSAAVPLQQVLIQCGRHWVQLCVAKTAFQAIPADPIQAEPGTGLMSTEHPSCTSQHAAFSIWNLRQDGKLWIIKIPWDQAWNPTLRSI